jgi:hypothetical protein
VWAAACVLVKRVLDIFFVVASNFDTRVVTVFVVVCAAVVCFIVDCIDVATSVSVIELVSDGTAGAVVVFVVAAKVGFVNTPVDGAAVEKMVGLNSIDDAAVVVFDLAVTVDCVLIDILVGAIFRICL